MRLFIALELPEDVKQALVAIQHGMPARLPVRRVAPAAMHLTLVFLGETDANTLPAIRAALHAALTNQAAISLSLAGVGAFPSARQPQVLWAGVGGETGALAALQARTAEAIVPLGFPRESRPYTAHVTLGRVSRNATNAERASIGRALQHASAPGLIWHANTVTVFESQLAAGGPIYTARDTITLRSSQ